jgi:polysaccharide biosynthesis protein PslJ
MRVIAGAAPETPFATRAFIAGTFGFLALTAVSPLPLQYVVPAVAFGALIAAFHRVLLNWHVIVGSLLLLILFIPIRRYTLPISTMGFQLEPYRVFVAFVVAGWAISLFVDRRVRLRRSGLEGPISLVWMSILGSLIWNANDIQLYGLRTDIIKSLTFFTSFFFVFFLVVSVLRPHHIRPLAKVLVAGGAVVAFLAIVEAQSGFNIFDHLADYIPILRHNVMPDATVDVNGFNRGDRARTYASAEHPIALAAALVMTLSLAIGLAATGSKKWWIAVTLLLMGAMATLSRTGILMIVVAALVFLWLRPRQVRRMWWMIFPMLVAVHFAMPHTLGIIKDSFFPKGGLIQEQKSSQGSATAGGRATDFAPVLQRVAQSPFFGVGYATTVVQMPGQPQPEDTRPASMTPPVTRILDNQWLGTYLETGLVGVIAWLWMFGRFVRRLGRAAKEDESPEGWLLAGIVAAVAANSVGMFTYDGFAFVQATFLFFILMAFGSVVGGDSVLRGERARSARLMRLRSRPATGS